MSIKLNNNKAFTIIELIVVVATLGILILLAGPKLLGYVEKAELTRIQHDVKVMENKMDEILNTNNKFNDWQNNGKDLGRVVMRKELYEKQGVAKFIDWEHLSAKWLRANNVTNSDELGVGGNLIELDDKYSTYKIIPKEYSSKINTKLKGTFYVNPLGKVYYEHDKPLGKASEKEILACVAPSTLGYEFEIIKGLGTITGWNGNATHLVIPASFKMSDGNKEWCEPVRVIGARAFQNRTFKKVTIPQSVEEIKDDAFQDGELTEIEIPHSVKTVGNNAFAGNPATNSGTSGGGTASSVVKGSSSGRNISNSAFGGFEFTYAPVNAKDLGVVTKVKTDSNGQKTVSIIGKTVISSGGSSSGSNLSNKDKDYSNTVITIPKELEVNGEILPVTEVDSGAFQGSGLIDVIMPEGLLYIHDYAFAGNQLIRAVIPNSVIEVGNYAFAYNEIASEPTIDPIKILESKFTGNFGDVNNEGNISKPVSSTIDLKDHIFITSSMGNHVIEDVGTNPDQTKDNDDEDVNNKVELMNPIESRNPIEGEIEIDSADKLAKIGKTGYPLNGKYILTANIDLSHIDNWNPIGNNSSNGSSSRFAGSFNGNGYSITGLRISRSTTDYVGLFGYTEGATISNVALEGINVTGQNRVGGLVGYTDINHKIRANVGYNYNGRTTISNSYATGSVMGSDYVGGLVGLTTDSTSISSSYATGSVTGGSRVGGLVGFANYSTIGNSYATGSVTGTGDWVGGLLGLAHSNFITRSYATGSVIGNSDVGGLVGYAQGDYVWKNRIMDSYATGSVTGTGGGLVGRADNDTTISNSYWDKETTGRTWSARGIGKTTEEMKKQTTYSGWDFNTSWQIDEGVSYPTLR